MHIVKKNMVLSVFETFSTTFSSIAKNESYNKDCRISIVNVHVQNNIKLKHVIKRIHVYTLLLITKQIYNPSGVDDFIILLLITTSETFKSVPV